MGRRGGGRRWGQGGESTGTGAVAADQVGQGLSVGMEGVDDGLSTMKAVVSGRPGELRVNRPGIPGHTRTFHGGDGV